MGHCGDVLVEQSARRARARVPAETTESGPCCVCGDTEGVVAFGCSCKKIGHVACFVRQAAQSKDLRAWYLCTACSQEPRNGAIKLELGLACYERHRETWATVCVANALGQLGELHAALDLLKRVADEELKRHGKFHVAALIAKRNLATCYRQLGRPLEALALQRESLAAAQKADHANLALDLKADLADTLLALSEDAEAEALLRDIVRSPRNADTITEQFKLGDILTRRRSTPDRRREGIRLIRSARAFARRLLGIEHPYTLKIDALLHARLHSPPPPPPPPPSALDTVCQELCW